MAHLGTEVEAEDAEVAYVELLLHLRLELLHLSFFSAGDDEVIDVDANEQDSALAAPPVLCHLVRALLEAHHLEHGV